MENQIRRLGYRGHSVDQPQSFSLMVVSSRIMSMSNHSIALGEPDGILKLPKAALRNQANWRQRDSDILAHLIQVQRQIHHSRWNKSDIRFEIQGDQLRDYAFPEFEHFVFDAVYFRQFIADNDRLLKDAVTRYCRFVDCNIRSHWLTDCNLPLPDTRWHNRLFEIKNAT